MLWYESYRIVNANAMRFISRDTGQRILFRAGLPPRHSFEALVFSQMARRTGSEQDVVA